jgi:hypothetical protein
MTDDWLREIDNTNIVGVVLLEFSAAFDIIDHSLLLEKRMCYGLTPHCNILDKELLTEHRGCSLMEADPTSSR